MSASGNAAVSPDPSTGKHHRLRQKPTAAELEKINQLVQELPQVRPFASDSSCVAESTCMVMLRTLPTALGAVRYQAHFCSHSSACLDNLALVNRIRMYGRCDNESNAYCPSCHADADVQDDQMFLAEVDVMRRLSHPHIIRYLGCGVIDEGGESYLAVV